MSRMDVHNYEAFLLDYAEGNLSPEEIAELQAFIVLHPELNIDLENLSLPYFPGEATFFEFKKELLKHDDELSAFDQRMISYLEGLLNENERSAFEKELSENPVLAREFSVYSKTKLSAGQEEFPKKENLLKLEELLNNPALLYTEGLLNEPEKLAFGQNVNHDKTLAAELQAYSKTKLSADASVVYPDKETLKKKTRVMALFGTRTLLSAAAAILLICGLVTLFNYWSPVSSSSSETAEHKKDTASAVKKIKDKNTPPQKKYTDAIDLSAKGDKALAKNSQTASAVRTNTNTGLELKRRPEKTEPLTSQENEFANQKKSSMQPNNEFPVKKDTALLASANPKATVKKEGQVKVTRFTELAYEEDVQDDVMEPVAEKNTFWKRAVKFAQGVNVLGFKAVSGEEKQKGDYLLSFNSVSVEKK